MLTLIGTLPDGCEWNLKALWYAYRGQTALPTQPHMLTLIDTLPDGCEWSLKATDCDHATSRTGSSKRVYEDGTYLTGVERNSNLKPVCKRFATTRNRVD
jgi:hypothetical protein